MISKKRLIFASCFGLFSMFWGLFHSQFMIGLVVGIGVFIILLMLTDPDRIRRENELRYIRENSRADEEGRESVRHHYRELEARNERIRKNPTGGLFGKSMFNDQFKKDKKPYRIWK